MFFFCLNPCRISVYTFLASAKREPLGTNVEGSLFEMVTISCHIFAYASAKRELLGENLKTVNSYTTSV